MWSNLQLTETQISDVYVRLGNDFNAAVAAFSAFEIDMRCVSPTPLLVQSAKYNPSDLMSIPEDLREVLETCLTEDATPDNLAIYLPEVRAIITRLLQGLRSKQSMYRRIVSEQRPSFRHRTPPVEPADVPAVARSLAALKKDDALERRAAKRFSTSHFSQMTGVVITRPAHVSVCPEFDPFLLMIASCSACSRVGRHQTPRSHKAAPRVPDNVEQPPAHRNPNQRRLRSSRQ